MVHSISNVRTAEVEVVREVQFGKVIQLWGELKSEDGLVYSLNLLNLG